MGDKRIILPSEFTKYNYIDKLVDNAFMVDTLGNENDTKNEDSNFYNYLPTTYTFFEELFNKYPFDVNDYFVDIGCGKGRALMMAALYGCKHICGIENNKVIFDSLMNNYYAWLRCEFMRGVDSDLINKSFFDVEIKNEWNKFFLFKPFNLGIFRRVMQDIYDSKKNDIQDVYIFLYHPDKEMIEWLEGENLFYLVEKDIQLIENSHGIMKKKIRSSVYSNHNNKHPEKTYWRY